MEEKSNYASHYATISTNVALGNDYRKEWIKHSMTLAAGVFAFTVAFYKDFPGVEKLGPDRLSLSLMALGWGSMILSLYFGIRQMRQWEDFYMVFRKDPRGYMKMEEAARLSAQADALAPSDTRGPVWREEARKRAQEGEKITTDAKSERDRILKGARWARDLQMWCLLGGLALVGAGATYDVWRSTAPQAVATGPAPGGATAQQRSAP